MKKSTRSALFVLLFAPLGLILFQNASTPTTDLKIFVSANGSDSNSGLCERKASETDPCGPLLSLEKAVRKASKVSQATPPDPDVQKIIIKIAPGIYRAQEVSWNLVDGKWWNVKENLKIPIVIEGADRYDRPVFDGRYPTASGTVSSFFRFTYNKGDTNLTIRNLKITYYNSGAIGLLGGPVSQTAVGTSGFSSGTTIENVTFDRIGSAWTFSDKQSYSALSIFNSRNNIIRNNIFSRIDDINYPSATGLHAIYVANFATGNLIEMNVFQNMKAGQPIKFRNRSDSNTVRNNDFIFIGNEPTSSKVAGRAAVYNWYFEPLNNPGYTDTPIECPNFNLTVDSNRSIQEPQVDNSITLDPLLYKAYPASVPEKSRCEDRGDTNVTVTNNTNQGCYVSVDNCPRMKRPELYEFFDTLTPTAQQGPSQCAARVSAWDKSCKIGQVDGEPRMVKIRYLKANQIITEEVKGNGCIVTASFCPRMDFWENMSKLDAKARAHTDMNYCASRAEDYYNSCVKEMKDPKEISRVKIRTQFFSNDTLQKTAIFPPQ